MADKTFEYVPNLTLEPDEVEKTAIAIIEEPEIEQLHFESVIALEMSRLTEAEQKQIAEFAEKIDITNANAVMTYGVSSQRNIASFSENALSGVRNRDMGEVGDMLSGLVMQLKGFGDEEKKGGFLGIKRKVKNQIETLKARYSKVSTNVDKISSELEKHQITLMKDAAMLDKMYEVNQAYFKELTMYIMAGKQKLEQSINITLPDLQRTAKETGLPEDAQAANDYANMINRFEKKIHDLELTRMISIQMAPQIRMIQNNDALMVEKIQTSIVNTIPLWKSQMLLALGMHHTQQAMEAQRAVTDMTNELLTKNAEKLKQGTIDVVKESERGVVDIETLASTNQRLIETLEEVATIQSEGKQRRMAAESELGRIESELKNKLIEMTASKS